MPQKYCGQCLETFLDILAEELKEGNSLMIQGFGCFSVWEQTERAGRNPRTGVSCTIPRRNSVKFRPGKTLLQKLNEAEKETKAAREKG